MARIAVIIRRDALRRERLPGKIERRARNAERIAGDDRARLAEGLQRLLQVAGEVMNGRKPAVDEGASRRVLVADAHLAELRRDREARHPAFDEEGRETRLLVRMDGARKDDCRVAGAGIGDEDLVAV